MAHQPVPRLEQADAQVEQVVQLGIAEANRLDLGCVVERSDRSEAVYLHVQRDTTWFGFRIACHAPVHACSRDYQQFLLPYRPDFAEPRNFKRIFASAIATGGIAVADPNEVRHEIERAEIQNADGVRVSDAKGWLWIWHAAKSKWVPQNAEVSEQDAPALTPSVKLSWRMICRIRHRLNHIARWTYDEFSADRGKLRVFTE